MKTILNIALAALSISLGGCRAYQTQRRTEQQDAKLLEYSQQHSLLQDANGYTRLWLYQSDSAFYFQLDSGLHSRGPAQLLWYEQGQHNRLVRNTLDSLRAVEQQQAYTQSESKSKKRNYALYCLMGAILGLIFIISLKRTTKKP